MVDDYWFLRQMMDRLMERHWGVVKAGRYIMKQSLYTDMRHWRKFSKQQTRHFLKQVATACPRVRFSNRGLFIPEDCLDAGKKKFLWTQAATK